MISLRILKREENGMETIISSKGKTVTIGPDQPTVIIGERINPTGKKRLAEALVNKEMDRVRQLALSQMADGATVLDVNVGAAGVDEVEVLPMAVKAVMETVDAPLCIDSANAQALRAALEVYEGKALINSVNGEEASMARVLPLVAEYGAAVIGLAMDDDGIPATAEQRIAIARKIVERAESLGIPRENVLIDCLALSVCTDTSAAMTTMQAIRGVRRELGVNMTLGVSNISFGLPDREAINNAFLAMTITAGVNAPIVNPSHSRGIILISDLLLGRDDFAMNYVTYFRECQAH
jgi:5-methyltetrahydrofolate--homocysteine methyltransferase